MFRLPAVRGFICEICYTSHRTLYTGVHRGGGQWVCRNPVGCLWRSYTAGAR